VAHDVFISYASEDKAAADAVCDQLEQKGIRCWIAPRDIMPGIPFAESITRAIRASGVFVILFSAHANRSRHVASETALAMDEGCDILPFRIENVLPSSAMKYYFSGVHWLDALTPPLESHIDRLSEAIRQLLALDESGEREMRGAGVEATDHRTEEPGSQLLEPRKTGGEGAADAEWKPPADGERRLPDQPDDRIKPPPSEEKLVEISFSKAQPEDFASEQGEISTPIGKPEPTSSVQSIDEIAANEAPKDKIIYGNGNLLPVKTKTAEKLRKDTTPTTTKSWWKQWSLASAVVVLAIVAVASGGLVTSLGRQGQAPLAMISTSMPIEAPYPTLTQTLPPTETATATPTHTPTLTPKLGLGSTRVSEIDGMIMVYVPEGNFWMGKNDGNNDERPMRQVFLDAYWIDRTEVTNRMYRACVEDGGCLGPAEINSATHQEYYTDAQYDDYPVVHVNWDKAQAYCTWAGRWLPTEAEWEKAARGPEGYLYPWGNQQPTGDKMNFADKNSNENADKTVDDGYADVAPVGSYPNGASPYGTLDMTGNVWEWVSDWYDSDYYYNSASSNPTGPSSGDYRVLRGGAYDNSVTKANAINRAYTNPIVTGWDVGFRCVTSTTRTPASTALPTQPLTETETVTPVYSFTQTKTLTPILTSTPASEKYGMVMIFVPAGEFRMGSTDGLNDEEPVHTIYLDTFWIDRTEVDNTMFTLFVEDTKYKTDAESIGSSYVYVGDGDWNKVDGASWQHPQGPSSSITGMDEYPVVHVSWNDASAYCEWAGKRLPTEAEWEKAARGTDERTYPWGFQRTTGNLLNFADANLDTSWADNNCNDGYWFTAPVGSYADGTSPYGVLDMAGNVWEWVADWYDEDYYANSPSSNPTGPLNGDNRVLRGGSWSAIERNVRSTLRLRNDPSLTWDNFGFRCAMDAESN
jgi:formylglycine-generating enzyme required for sulfatase activity